MCIFNLDELLPSKDPTLSSFYNSVATNYAHEVLWPELWKVREIFLLSRGSGLVLVLTLPPIVSDWMVQS